MRMWVAGMQGGGGGVARVLTDTAPCADGVHPPAGADRPPGGTPHCHCPTTSTGADRSGTHVCVLLGPPSFGDARRGVCLKKREAKARWQKR